MGIQVFFNEKKNSTYFQVLDKGVALMSLELSTCHAGEGAFVDPLLGSIDPLDGLFIVEP